jgi:hypothetical protein
LTWARNSPRMALKVHLTYKPPHAPEGYPAPV